MTPAITPRSLSAIALTAALVFLSACNLPGRPKEGPEVPRPEEVRSFDRLYGDNCAGCHGANGQNGAATNLANPEYQGLIDDTSLRDVIAHGWKGTLMPAFSRSSGGPLTDAQVEVLVQGMRARWRTAAPFGKDQPPPYKATRAGDPAKGRAVYATACARCHDEPARATTHAGNLLDGSFLALINEQTLRTTIIAGRPDIGEPDWRAHIPGRAMTDDEITDVCAWLLAQKPATPGQPYADTTSSPHGPQPSPAARH